MKKILSIALSLIALAQSVTAADFFSTEECPELFTLGVRLGVNTSNRTLTGSLPGGYRHMSWGTGFDLGVTADINIKNYLSVRPELFYQSRSGDYAFITSHMPIVIGETDPLSPYYITQVGHRRSYNFIIPVLASFHFNITDDLRWNVDIGPYVGFTLGSKLKNEEVLSTDPVYADAPTFSQKASPMDFGVKFGTGFTLLTRYTFGIHYQAGMVKAWKDRRYDVYREVYGGRTKAWVFTVGYNF